MEVSRATSICRDNSRCESSGEDRAPNQPPRVGVLRDDTRGAKNKLEGIRRRRRLRRATGIPKHEGRECQSVGWEACHVSLNIGH